MKWLTDLEQRRMLRILAFGVGAVGYQVIAYLVRIAEGYPR